MNEMYVQDFEWYKSPPDLGWFGVIDFGTPNKRAEPKKTNCRKCGQAITSGRYHCDKCIEKNKPRSPNQARICAICGESILNNHGRVKYCHQCKQIKLTQQYREAYQRRKRCKN